ncbi:MAG: peptide chain release factor-like protein [Phycisphaeraceae bacterium]|nr:peptide chain release factor-like protein [Phycisphaerae bacterium]MBX3393036.1 peptide chain release factor-like protein [Phycisphaeraceae bacterium]
MTHHPAALDDQALLDQCRLEKSRSGGPGGQHRNKVETLVTITHQPTGLSAHAGERRRAIENKQVAITRLRLVLAVHVRTPVPLGEARSELWIRRTPARRIVCSTDHRDFPAMIAEALDMAHATRYDHRLAATRLGVSPTQLTRFVARHPPALAWWNHQRAALGHHPRR